MGNSDEDAQIGTPLEVENKPSIFNRLPSRFEKKPVLRINVGSFSG
jgi:hypothetical protein